MTTQIAIGFSQDPDPAQAVKEIVVQIKSQINQPTIDFILCFCSPLYAREEVTYTIERLLKPKRLAGCSTPAFIIPEQIRTKGLALLAICSDEIHFGLGVVKRNAYQDPRQAGFDLARETTTDFQHHLRHLFMFFCDGVLKNNTSFVRGIQEVVGSGAPTMGAVSRDEYTLKKTFQICQNQILTDTAVGILMGGQMSVVLGNKHGWRPLGKPRTITRAENNVIHEIDQKPAVSVYQEYLGEEIKNIHNTRLGPFATLYPLGMYMEEEQEYLLRNAVDILEDGSIVCQCDIPENAEVHIMISNKESIKQAAADAAHMVRDGLFGRQAKLILVFESLSRLKILGRSAIQEIQLIKDILGYTTPIFGMYTNGEISPFHSLQNVRSTYLHNESINIIAIG